MPAPDPHSPSPAAPLPIKPRQDCRWDVVSLGEVMLRFDPGEQRITQARHFEVCEGGGEYNVARGLSRCFRQRSSIVTALVDNPIGRLIESLMLGGGVDASHVLWREFDGMGHAARNGIYFLERGFGVRGALGMMDRGHAAIAQLHPGEIDWDHIFGTEGARFFHTGGIFCGLSETAPAVAQEAMESARWHGTRVSFDCNYRPSLWRTRGGRSAAARVNRALLPYIDVLFGHEGDVAQDASEAAQGPPRHDHESFAAMAARVAELAPQLSILATTVRTPHTAGANDWGGFAWCAASIAARTAAGETTAGPLMPHLDILDRVGGGDGFVGGFLYGLLIGRDIAAALAYGVAHGALVMTTSGDNSFATLAEVEQLIAGAGAGVQR